MIQDDHWASEVLSESESQNLEFDETLNQILRFRMLLINFIKGCPYELIEDIYCAKVIGSVLTVHCRMSLHNMKSLLTCVQTHSLVNLLIAASENCEEIIADAATPLQCSWLAVAVLKTNIDDERTSELLRCLMARPNSQMVQQLDR